MRGRRFPTAHVVLIALATSIQLRDGFEALRSQAGEASRIHTDRVDELDAAAANRTKKTPPEVVAAPRATIPAARYGRVEEFAAVLVSGPASYVTGSIVRCDGGMIRVLVS